VTSYAGSVDMRPAQNIIVYVTATLNTATGVATWNFTSLDPATMLLTTDPTAGFLPPDTTPPVGIGHVAFTINPLNTVADAAAICNTATVVFDTNSPINTAQYCNTKDVSPPTSMVQALPASEPTSTFTVSWSGSDAGSGVATYTVYVSDNRGAFAAWQTATTATSGSYTGKAEHTYGFYSIATDMVGNTEVAKTQAEATTTVSNGGGTGGSGPSYIFITNSGGSVSSLFSNGAAQSSAVSGGGIGAAVDRNGLVFSITADGTGVSTFNDNGTMVSTTSGVLTGASALAIDGGDQLWIASPGSLSMGQILGSGQVTYTDSTLQKPSGVAIDISGNIWISDSQSNTVHEIVGGGMPARPLANAVTSKTPGMEPQ
jgi:hypothetical protein